MPGLVAVISREPPESCRERVRLMLAAMRHDSSYGGGTASFEDVGVYLGWTRHAGVAEERHRFSAPPGELSVFLAGEAFPAGLDRLLRRYETAGDSFPAELNGWFAGVLVDRRSKTCLLFNDRYGLKRVFWHQGPRSLLLATEAKALLRVLPETRSFDPQGLAEFLTCGCTLGTRSLYRGIGVLPGASRWTIGRDGVEKSTYFERGEWERQEPLPAREFEAGVGEVLPSIVRKYAEAETPIGVSLTGGLDSRMLMASLDGASGELPCYTFGSMYRDTFDVAAAREVARKCGRSHRVLVLGKEFLAEFPRYFEQAVYRSDGYLGMSGAAELYVNTLAREVAPVRLTGNYGSEVLRGVRAFRAEVPKALFLKGEIGGALREARETFRGLAQAAPLSFSLFEQAPHQGFGRSAIEESAVIMRTPFLDNDLARLLYRRPAGWKSGARLSLSIIAANRPDLLSIPTDRGDLGSGGSLLRFLRRTCRLALFKGEYWATHAAPGGAKGLLYHLAAMLPPKALAGRHKFQHFGSWLRNELSDYLHDVLLKDVRSSEHVDAGQVARMAESHLQGRENLAEEIDMALTIALSERLMLKPAGR